MKGLKWIGLVFGVLGLTLGSVHLQVHRPRTPVQMTFKSSART